MYPALRAHIEKIVPLTDSEYTMLCEHFTSKSFAKNEYIVREGEPVRYNYFILSGLTKLVYTEESGKEHILSFAMEDWWDNDFQAWYYQSAAKLSMVCLEPTDCLCLTLEHFHQLCLTFPKFEHFFVSKAIGGFLASQRRILSLMTSDAQARYRQFVQYYPSLIQRLPKTQLAAYLGVSRETLSRLVL
ncbi:MAG: Crp/Fnr family transcriptional regulator [Chitinophagaceae bacterium]|nr:MAG: Crp/Fnr family transcriptional regulator [Chitinophagaceae bacterium]